MYFSRVTVTNFRNIQSLDLQFDQGFIVLAGENGVGKTNFLESLYFGARLRKFPESKLRNLFLRSSNFFRLGLDVQNGGDKNSLGVVAQEDSGKIFTKPKINNQDTTRLKYQTIAPVISFLPQDLNLLTHSPLGRRNYLDETLSLISTEYRFALGNYSRALKQRNEVFQKIIEGHAGPLDLGIWDSQLVNHGSLVTGTRQLFMRYLNSRLPEILRFISPQLTETSFVYNPSAPVEQAEYERQLNSLRPLELKRGSTLLGPHRDDFFAQFRDENVVGVFSRGQLRALTIALKILERQYTEEILGRVPVLLLDDVFSEFDEQHQRQLIEFFTNGKQIFFTTTRLSEIQSCLPPTKQVFVVAGGVISHAV